LTFLYYI